MLDPRNVELLTEIADNYDDLRRFDNALKLYDRALEIRPNDVDLLASKAGIYQAQGNLTQAARCLEEVNALTPSYEAVPQKVDQLIFERNYREAVQLLETRFAQFQFGSELEVGAFQEFLASSRLLAGDTAGAKASAEQARNILEVLCKNQPDNDFPAIHLARTYAILGDKESAYKEAERVSALVQNDASRRPGAEENLALIDASFGNNVSRYFNYRAPPANPVSEFPLRHATHASAVKARSNVGCLAQRSERFKSFARTTRAIALEIIPVVSDEMIKRVDECVETWLSPSIPDEARIKTRRTRRDRKSHSRGRQSESDESLPFGHRRRSDDGPEFHQDPHSLKSKQPNRSSRQKRAADGNRILTYRPPEAHYSAWGKVCWYFWRAECTRSINCRWETCMPRTSAPIRPKYIRRHHPALRPRDFIITLFFRGAFTEEREDSRERGKQ